MKRRLDLALALIHEPRILFLDEPTTGLDIQSRTALWDEVARLAREEGVTVFLTTQYLEEADALADRVGIIDHGKLVAEGTPAELKAEIGRPTVEAAPADAADARARSQAVLGRFGEPLPAAPRRGRRAPRATAPRSWPTSSARSTPRASGSPTSAPRADARRRLPRQDRPLARGRRGRGQPRRRTTGEHAREPVARLRDRDCPSPPPQPAAHAGALPRVALGHAHRAPADHDRADARLPAVPARDQRQRPRRRDRHPRLPRPTPTSTFALAFPFMQGAIFATNTAGTNLAEDIGTGFFNRLSLTPMRGSALLAGQLAGVLLVAIDPGGHLPAAGLAAGAHFEAGLARRAGAVRALVRDLRRVRRDRPVRRPALGLGRGRPGPVPADVRAALPQLGRRCRAT